MEQRQPTRRPVADRLFTWPPPTPPETPALLGSKCEDCGAVLFPIANGCSRCGSRQLAEHRLPDHGTLFTWTTQEFLPKAPYAGPETPETFQPWAIGYVQLGDEVRVESRLYDVDPAALAFDLEMQFVIRPFTVDDDGTEVWTFGFRPSSPSGTQEITHV